MTVAPLGACYAVGDDHGGFSLGSAGSRTPSDLQRVFALVVRAERAGLGGIHAFLADAALAVERVDPADDKALGLAICGWNDSLFCADTWVPSCPDSTSEVAA